MPGVGAMVAVVMVATMMPMMGMAMEVPMDPSLETVPDSIQSVRDAIPPAVQAMGQEHVPVGWEILGRPVESSIDGVCRVFPVGAETGRGLSGSGRVGRCLGGGDLVGPSRLGQGERENRGRCACKPDSPLHGGFPPVGRTDGVPVRFKG